MQVDITHAVALVRHPDAVEAIISKVRAGTAQDRNSDPSGWKWYYSFGVLGTSISGAQFVARMFDPAATKERIEAQTARNSMSAEERASEVVSRCTTVGLHGDCKRSWVGRVALADGYVPPEVHAYFLNGAKREVAERERLAALSDADRKAEMTTLLGEEATAILTAVHRNAL